MRNGTRKTLLALLLVLGVNMMQDLPTIIVRVEGQPQVPYTLGNWTYVSKPIYPTKVNSSQIRIGENWTYVYDLVAGSLYHVYFYGDWIDYTPLANKSDYDVYVYNPLRELESLHTESAGLPEHLGTTVYEPFFKPRFSGNYSILVVNDVKESRGEKAGTLMVIEYRKCNQWYTQHVVGKVDNKSVEDTFWAYEFVTTSPRVEVWVDVPDTLDMYEAQLYLMANPANGMGTIVNGVPLAWEPGLYGNLSGPYGGYRLEAEGFSHANASASCEYWGQDMLINYTCPTSGGPFLYHLGLIAENGEGDIRFMFKTDFEPPSISIENPIQRAYPDQDPTITARVRDNGTIERVLLNYTIDDWNTWASIEMSPSQNDSYVATIPRQPAGSTVRYKVIASDAAGNTAEKESRYIVKDLTTLTLLLSQSVIKGGESILVTGSISRGSTTVTLEYTWQKVRISRQVQSVEHGGFSDQFTPDKAGAWTVSASWPGDGKAFEVTSGPLSFKVEKASTSIMCNLEPDTTGEGAEISGSISPPLEGMKVSFVFTKPDGSTTERYLYTNQNGSFDLIFKPDLSGTWRVQANFAGDELRNPSNSNQMSFVVSESWINQHKYHLIALVGISSVLLAGGFFFFRKKEEEEE